MVYRFRASAAAAFLCITVSAVAAGRLELVTPPLIAIASDTTTATGVIVVRNSGNAPLKPALVVGTFVVDPMREPLAIAAKLTLPATLAAGATAEIPVALSNVTEPGYAKAELRDGARPLGDLRVLKKAFAFNVAPVGYDGKEPFALHLIYGQKGALTLLNSDEITHSFVWAIREGQREIARGRVPLLRPNEMVDVDLPPESTGWLKRIEGRLQSPQSPGRLILRAVPRGGDRLNEYFMTKEVPLQLRRTAGEGASRDLSQMGWILLLLLLGGLTSLYLTYWVPNTLTKMNVKARIEELTSKIQMLHHTAPTLRVALSVRRNQIRARLNSRHVLSIEFATLAAECEQRMAALKRQIELAQKIESLLIEIAREWASGTTLGPTVLNRAAEILHKSVAQLEQGELTDEDLRAIEAQVAQATQNLRSMPDDVKSTQELVARALELQSRKPELLPLVSVATSLAPALNTTDAAAISGSNALWRLDYAVTKLEVAASVQDAVQRQELLKLLRLHSLDAFQEAHSQARQIRELISADQMKKALENKAVRIHFHPELPKVNTLVSFELKLSDPLLHSAALKRTLTCRWAFGDGLHEDGWRVSHYYASPGTFSVTATVTDRLGAKVAIDPVTVRADRAHDELLGARTRVEWIRLGVALFVVLLGLLGGAKEQLARLDFVPALVALFLLGVTADQIKNLIAPRTP